MTFLLLVIAASVLWGFVLREPVTLAWRGYRQRQRVVSGVVVTQPVVTPAPESTPSVQLLLCDAHGTVEHEIALHQDELPETYTYAGKTYSRDARHHGKGHTHDHDVVWEYRR